METLEEIKKIIDWWFNLKKGYNSIDHLMEVNRKLSGHCYYLAEFLADNYQDYLFYYSKRKIGEIKKKQHLIENESFSAAKAESYARASIMDELQNEIIQEGNYERIKVLLRQANLIIQQIDNKIYRLRKEQEQTKKD